MTNIGWSNVLCCPQHGRVCIPLLYFSEVNNSNFMLFETASSQMQTLSASEPRSTVWFQPSPYEKTKKNKKKRISPEFYH